MTFRQGGLAQLWDELVRDVGGNLAGSRPETRARKRARAGSDTVSEATLRLVKRHVANGAPRKGLDVLLSPVAHDPEDPQVAQKL